MEITELFDYILSKGCGTDLESYKDSKEYKALLQKQNSLFEKYGEDTDEGVMLRAGQFTSTRLLNCYPEQEALALARKEESKFGHGLEKRALIEYIGEEILRAAKDQLPEDAVYMAEMWSVADADMQIAITKKLYYMFTHDSQRDGNSMSSENLIDILIKERNNKTQFSGEGSCLPLIYGKWNNENHLANCQGKSQMIIAFARLCGANVILMNPNVTARCIIEEQRKIALNKAYEDIESRGIAFPDPEYMDSLKASILKSEMKEREDCFHLCPVVQVCDGRWVVIDSNALNWGVLTDNWKMNEIYSRLKKYEEVIPGVALYTSDNKSKDEAILKMWQEFDNILSHSKNIEEILAPVTGFEEMIEAFAKSDELDYILTKSFNITDVALEDLEFRKLSAARILFGDPSNIFALFFEDIQNFFQKKKDSLCTYYHCMASDLIDERWCEDGTLIHPEGSFISKVASHVAISAINSVGIDNEVYGTSSLLADYSCCPTTMHNVLLSPCASSELRAAAAMNLSCMPFLHDLTKRSLTIKKYFDEQRKIML